MTENAGATPPDESDVAAVLSFWFEDLGPEDWFKRNPAVDERIRERFAGLYASLARAVPSAWRQSVRGMLAAVIVLDQFPRNMFRDSARAFENDDAALTLAKAAVDAGLDRELPEMQRYFLYMPFQHSEDPADQARSVALFCALGDTEGLDWAERHKRVIDRFGRFPHRNAVLGRQTTPEEAAFLDENSMGF